MTYIWCCQRESWRYVEPPAPPYPAPQEAQGPAGCRLITMVTSQPAAALPTPRARGLSGFQAGQWAVGSAR